jgi:hypothetical protein
MRFAIISGSSREARRSVRRAGRSPAGCRDRLLHASEERGHRALNGHAGMAEIEQEKDQGCELVDQERAKGIEPS